MQTPVLALALARTHQAAAYDQLQTPALTLALALALTRAHQAAAYDQSLGNCKTAAALFQNPCAHGRYDTPATSVSAMQSQTFACANTRGAPLVLVAPCAHDPVHH